MLQIPSSLNLMAAIGICSKQKANRKSTNKNIFFLKKEFTISASVGQYTLLDELTRAQCGMKFNKMEKRDGISAFKHIRSYLN